MPELPEVETVKRRLSPSIINRKIVNVEVFYSKYNHLSSIKDEVIIIMNMEKRTLKFIIDNEDKGDQYTDIPIDKPLFPTVLLVDKDDSIEIINYK